ncbi:SDR family NAD(P)-dependent oxidoreductase [Psychrobacter sp. FDAARGOS_221]|uniref:SDR family NAD(P)-dependent oxidoreductase n=1 Tax=Psychrobacter sp. FDAARGOS_221 TaxID=1975705 RepID=UPI000BB55E7B|nr:SDR family NAD(P)-dependent oxidoreductase [Psychrobacter sp. FDAARGOS_221]PNK60444.1 KR domain-containing protein [Psychrobacter sp. FDAARGOS_221]
MRPSQLLTAALPPSVINNLRAYLPFTNNLPLIKPTIDEQQLTEFYQSHVAAITGAGSGIGRQLALNLAQAGCHLALSDINDKNLAETYALLKPYSVKVTTTVLDVSDKNAVFAWAEQVMADHGKVNFIFNNAGVALSSTVEGESIDDIEWVMGINFWGMVYGTKAFLPLIKQSLNPASDNSQSEDGNRQHHGHIINISSLFGLIALPGQSAYNASKFAIRGFNESLRQELAIENSGVSITSVHPGGIKTNIANNARGNDSIGSLGMPTGARGIRNFNRLLKFDPDMAAKIILMAAANNQPRCLIGDDAKLADLLQRITPSHYGPLMAKATKLAAGHKGKKSKNKRKKQNEPQK